MTLKFKKEKQFKIIQFTDVHWNDGGKKDLLSNECMRNVLKNEKPDFVIFTGDLVHGTETNDLENMLSNALEPVIESGIPWAHIFENHDTECGSSSKVDFYETLIKFPGCISKENESGAFNRYDYVLSILGSGENAQTPAWEIYCFDSGEYVRLNDIDPPSYSYIFPKQINWYIERSMYMEVQNGKVPALAFMHIPLPEHYDVWDRSVCYGSKNEKVSSPLVNSGFFSSVLQRKDIKGIFVGHDHINDYFGELYGVKLGYGRKTGHSTYPRDGENSGMHRYGLEVGARVFLLREEDKTFETYISTQSGAVVTEQIKHEPDNNFFKD